MYRKTKKLFAVSLVVTMLLTMTLFSGIASAATALQGSDRYATALNIVKAGWTTSENAVIARGDDLADALAAAPLAFAKGKAPILLTETSALPTGVLEELTALGVKNVYIVGGTGAVSANVEAALAAKFTVKRLGGANRAATSLLVANEAFPTAPAKAVLVNGEATADALSVSSAAAYNGMPILLADSADAVAADVAAYLAGKTVYAVGGTGVLSNAVVGSATRLAGDNRYATNVAVLNAFTFNYSKVFVAVGEDSNNVDALGGAAFAAVGNNPMVLVDGALTADQTSLLTSKLTSSSVVYTLGGATPASVAAAIEAIVNAIEFKVNSVTVLNGKEVQVAFTKALSGDAATALSNITITRVDGTDSNTFSAALSTDKKVLTITASNVFAGKYAITAKPDIKDADNEALVAYTGLFTVSDTTRPAVSKVEYTDYQNVKVTFTEALSTFGAITTSSSKVTTTNSSGKTLLISLATADKDTDYTVTLMGAKDYAGNFLSPNPTVITVRKTVADTTKPTVSAVTPVSAKEVKVTFSEKLVADPTITVNGVSGTLSKDDSGLVYTLTLASSVVPSGDSSAVATVAVSSFTDLSGNAGDAYSRVYTFTADTTKPTMTGYKVETISGKEYLVVTFSENVTLAAGTASVSGKLVKDYVESTVSATALTATSYNPADDGTYNAIQLDLAPLTVSGGTYTLKLAASSVKDLSNNYNAEVANLVVVRGSNVDVNKPAITGVSKDGNTVVNVTFNKKLDYVSALNTSNYVIEGASVQSAIFTQNDTAQAVVKLTLAAGSVTINGERPFIVSNVKSAAGYTMDTDARTITLNENVAPTITGASLTSTSTIKVTLSEAIDVAKFVDGSADLQVNVGDTHIAVSGTNSAVTYATYTTGDKFFTITLVGSDVITDLSKAISVEVLSTSSLTDTNGNLLAPVVVPTTY